MCLHLSKAYCVSVFAIEGFCCFKGIMFAAAVITQLPFPLQRTMKKVHENLNQVKHYQDQMRAHEARDRNIQEHNFIRVNQFSLLFIVVMLGVGAVQVIMVRSLFEERSRLHKLFRLLC